MKNWMREKSEVLRERWNDKYWYYTQFSKRVAQLHGLTKGRKDCVVVLEEEWDNLIILDGCRYDIFAEKVAQEDLDGTLQKKLSQGSATPQFLRRNFGQGNIPDVIYITTTPFSATRLEEPFYKTVHLWQDAWDDELGTVHPRDVTQAAIKMHNNHPDKRLIVHYMQPHVPFIGDISPTGSVTRIGWEEGGEYLKKAYRSNLDAVFPHVEELLDAVPGRTVITSDHGNFCGERVPPLSLPMYGHPYGVKHPAVLEVPWFTVK